MKLIIIDDDNIKGISQGELEELKKNIDHIEIIEYWNIKKKKELQHLLNKVNKVTAYHRHGNKIPTTALNELANAQIVYENSQFEESSFNKQKLIEYQLCPKCNGQGTTSRPPWVPYDQNEWTSSNSSYPCNICNGVGIIPKATM